MKSTRLVSAEDDKFYEMQQVDERTFRSTWGRKNGGETISTDHDMSAWDDLVATKKGMGYVVEAPPANEAVAPTYEAFLLREGITPPEMAIALRERVSDGEEDPEDDDDPLGLNVADHIIGLQQKIVDAM